MKISELIEDACGFKTVEDFDKYYERKYSEGVSQEEINRLAPENIDLGEFWGYLNDKFPRAVCGAKLPEFDSIEGFRNAVNSANWWHAEMIGGNSFLRGICGTEERPYKLLEIGPGFGVSSLTLNLNGNIDHTKIDVYPLIDGVIRSDGFTIPSEIPVQSGVYSCNVFQHFSLNQRRNYYKEVYRVLNDWGVFFFSMYSPSGGRGIKHIDRPDEYYICHMGQFTQIQTYSEVCRDLTEAGFSFGRSTIDKNGLMSFLVEKIPK